MAEETVGRLRKMWVTVSVGRSSKCMLAVCRRIVLYQLACADSKALFKQTTPAFDINFSTSSNAINVRIVDSWTVGVQASSGIKSSKDKDSCVGAIKMKRITRVEQTLGKP